jgi:sugar phosphate isomerase/epimerase
MAKKFGLAGVQVTIPKSLDGKTLPLEDTALQHAWNEASKQYSIPLNATCLEMLHQDCLKDNAHAPEWVHKGIAITKNLNAGILMLVFFNACQVLKRPELDYVIDQVKELLPEAQRAGIILGFENTISGEENRYAVDKVNSQWFKVWYDVGNSVANGFDAPKEIRALGRDRICAFHFKDKKGYLGEGEVNMPEVLRAIRDIRFEGVANLETKVPTGVEADLKHNLDNLRKLMED